jgi:hypothetical protein
LYGLLFQIGGKDGSQPSVFLKQPELDEALCLAQIQDQLKTWHLLPSAGRKLVLQLKAIVDLRFEPGE